MIYVLMIGIALAFVMFLLSARRKLVLAFGILAVMLLLPSVSEARGRRTILISNGVGVGGCGIGNNAFFLSGGFGNQLFLGNPVGFNNGFFFNQSRGFGRNQTLIQNGGLGGNFFFNESRGLFGGRQTTISNGANGNFFFSR